MAAPSSSVASLASPFWSTPALALARSRTLLAHDAASISTTLREQARRRWQPQAWWTRSQLLRQPPPCLLLDSRGGTRVGFGHVDWHAPLALARTLRGLLLPLLPRIFPLLLLLLLLCSSARLSAASLRPSRLSAASPRALARYSVYFADEL